MPTIITRIVGTQHYPGAQTKLNALRNGNAIELVREPDEPHDPDAVSCMKDGVFLGYVPRKDNRQLAAALDRGEEARCEIHVYQPTIRITWGDPRRVATSGVRRYQPIPVDWTMRWVLGAVILSVPVDIAARALGYPSIYDVLLVLVPVR